MKEVQEGSIVLMIKNEDGSFSPLGVDKNDVAILSAFLGKLSESTPLVKSKERYVQTTWLSTTGIR